MANIVRIYDTEDKAREAVRKLADDGFPADAICLVTPSVAGGEEGEPAGASGDALSTAMVAGGLMGDGAELYASRVRAGRSIVAVPAAFGYGRRAMDIMDEVGPVDTDVRPPEDPYDWNEGTPFSASVSLPVLTRNRPAPLSGLIGLTPLIEGRATFGTLTSSKYFPSAVTGPLLSRKAAPLSSMFGLKTLLTKRGPWRSSFGMPLLSKAAAPFSSMMNLPLLSRNPAPLSSLFGFRLLLPENR
jgi:hypothetical protein